MVAETMTLSDIIKPILQAEKMAPAGSYEQDQFVKAALRNAWPKIRTIAEMERVRSKGERIR